MRDSRVITLPASSRAPLSARASAASRAPPRGGTEPDSLVNAGPIRWRLQRLQRSHSQSKLGGQVVFGDVVGKHSHCAGGSETAKAALVRGGF